MPDATHMTTATHGPRIDIATRPRCSPRLWLLPSLLLAAMATSAADPVSAPTGEPAARLDLQTPDGVAAVRGAWRYADAELVPTTHRAPDANGQPTGAPVKTWDVQPRAGGVRFDDSGWTVVEPARLPERRGHGRVSFNWYRINVTVPDRVGAFDTNGATLVFSTSLDDYAEVWVDGELPRAPGQEGGSVVAGWNATNRLVIGRNVHPGQRIQLALFGINGPISDPPANFIWMRHAALEFYPAGPVPLAVTPQEVNVAVERLDAAIDALVPPNAKLFKLAEGFQFSEGPVWVRDGGYLLFSDPNANRIYAYAEQSATLSLYRPQSGYDGADVAEYSQPGSNGLALDAQGRLTINQHGHRRVVRVEPDGTLTVLAARDSEGRRLNSPNDLVYRSDGSVYFTDPPFGLPKFYTDLRKEIPYSGVYRAKDGVSTLLAQGLRGPNGLAFSRDERVLYVDNWDPEAKVVLRYPVREDGTLGAPETFADLTREVPGDEALDGLKVDAQGNVWVAGPDGLRVYSAAGQHLGTIRAPRPIHNFTWGGADGRTLYLTARDRLYRMPLLVGGAQP
jgi:gluconolactonase